MNSMIAGTIRGGIRGGIRARSRWAAAVTLTSKFTAWDVGAH